ncbi:MAG: Dna2/Cas4 domain-containing protein, partial [Armatimonadota bacterium]|nr:CRISPR-associated protein Cas4 [Armatimonadota bacterium]MDW8144019.1 Dna2/Cas4 domain-containing protein [Armatimonadota bacterium]
MQVSLERLSDEEFEQLRTNGVKVNYWAICHRKVWLYAKGLRMEPLSDRVALGRILHERAYPDMPRREVLVDNLIKIDLIEHESKLLEVKHSRKLVDAARLQVAYYLLYLKWLGAGELVGE